MAVDIEDKVVQMKFDNKEFEKRVRQSMGTLDKLKQSLKFEDSTKGFDKLDSASKKLNFLSLTDAIGKVKVEFSAMQVVGISALHNLTTAAMRTGKNVFDALMIKPVTTGFSEYETKINSIQTIMSNTASKGTTMADVTKVIDKLNLYADKTIYNFAEMTRNIGTFTAAGIGLEDSASAIQGIANLAAASGSTSQQASTAMYQLSQALAAGTVKLMDWNSVVNAGMGGEKFQNALKQTAREMGISVDAIIKDAGSFRDSLSKGWITADVLNTTLHKFTVEGAKEYSESMLKMGEYTQEQADALLKEATAMEDAATKVKTFTQLCDTLKEAAQSGWGRTWEIIVGDFEEAKDFFTELSDLFGGIINSISDARNKFLDNALTSRWKQLSTTVSDAGIDISKFKEDLLETAKVYNPNVRHMLDITEDFEDSLKLGWLDPEIVSATLMSYAGGMDSAGNSTSDAAKKLSEFHDIASRVIRGDFGNGETRRKKLADAGYEYAEIQGLVNKMVRGEEISLEDLSDAQLKNIGISDEQAETIRKLAIEAKESGTPINELIMNMYKPSGRELIIDTLRNSINGLISIAKSVKKAWRNVFDPLKGSELYNFIESLNKVSKKFMSIEDHSEEITKVFEGFFAIINAVISVIRKAFSVVVGFFTTLFGYVDGGFLGLISKIGGAISDAAKYLKDWANAHNVFSKMVKKAAPDIQKFNSGVEQAVTNLSKSTKLSKWLKLIKKTFTGMFDRGGKYLDKGMDVFDAFLDRVHKLDGFTFENVKIAIDDFFNSVFKYFFNTKKITRSVRNSFKTVHKGIKDDLHVTTEDVASFGKNLLGVLLEVKDRILDNISFGDILAVVVGITSIKSLKRLSSFMGSIEQFFGTLRAPLAALSSIPGLVSKGISEMNDTIRSFGAGIKARSFKNIAIAIGILAASLAVLALVPQEDLREAAISLAIIMVAFVALVKVMSKMGDTKGLNQVALVFLSIAASVGILSMAIKVIEDVSWGDMAKCILGIAAMVAVLGVAAFALNKTAPNFAFGAVSMIAIAAAAYIMAGAIKKMQELDLQETINMMATMAWALLLLGASVGMSAKAGLGTAAAVLATVIALNILIDIFHKIEEIDADNIRKHMEEVAWIFGTFAALMLTSKFAGKNAAKGGLGILAMSLAFINIIHAFKMISKVKPRDITKGLIVLGFLAKYVMGLMFVMMLGDKDAGKHAAQVGLMIVAISGAMILLTASLAIMSHIKPRKLYSAVGAMSIIMAMIAAIIAVSSLAKECYKTVIAIGIIVGVLAVTITVLSVLEPGKLLGASLALSMVLGMFAALMFVSSKMHKAFLGALSMVAIAATIGAMIGLLVKSGADNVMSVAKSISIVLLSLSASCLILAAVGAVALPAIIGLGVLMLVLGGIEFLCGTLEGLLLYIPTIEKVVNTGFPILSAMANGLGEIFGSYIGGILEGVTSGLPNIGRDLGDFMTNAQPFFDGISALDETSMTGVKNLAEAILILTGSSVVDGIFSFATGKSSLSDFGTNLKTLGMGVAMYAATISSISEESMQKVKDSTSIIDSLAEASKNVPGSGGWWDRIFGNNDIDKFGAKLVSFGGSLAEYAKKVEDLKTNGLDNSIKAAESVKEVIDIADSIPNSGGLLGDIVGNNDIDDFGIKLSTFGWALTEYSKSVANINPDDITSVNPAIESLINLANQLPVSMDRDKNFEQILGFLRDALSAGLLVIKDNYVSFRKEGSFIFLALLNGMRDPSNNTQITIVISGVILKIVSVVDAMRFHFVNSGKFMAEGFAEGIEDNAYLAAVAATAMANAASFAARRTLDEHSPSKVSYKIGDYFGIAFVKAILDNSSDSYRAGSTIAQQAKDGLNSTVQNIFRDLDLAESPEIVIRPVLDLSNVEDGSRRINAMISRDKAISINAGIESYKKSTSDLPNTTSNSNYNFTFNQTNNSPKPLSRIDIYRQSKNQFSQLRRLVKT